MPVLRRMYEAGRRNTLVQDRGPGAVRLAPGQQQRPDPKSELTKPPFSTGAAEEGQTLRLYRVGVRSLKSYANEVVDTTLITEFQKYSVKLTITRLITYDSNLFPICKYGNFTINSPYY